MISSSSLKKFSVLIAVLVAIAVLSSFLRIYGGQDQSTSLRIGVNNIQWGSTPQQESEAFSVLGLKASDAPEGNRVWENSTVSVRVARSGRIELVDGNCLYVNDVEVLRKGQEVSEISGELASAFLEYKQDKNGLFVVAATEREERYIIVCRAHNGKYLDFTSEPLPPANTPYAEKYPYSLFRAPEK